MANQCVVCECAYEIGRIADQLLDAIDLKDQSALLARSHALEDGMRKRCLGIATEQTKRIENLVRQLRALRAHIESPLTRKVGANQSY